MGLEDCLVLGVVGDLSCNLLPTCLNILPPTSPYLQHLLPSELLPSLAFLLSTLLLLCLHSCFSTPCCLLLPCPGWKRKVGYHLPMPALPPAPTACFHTPACLSPSYNTHGLGHNEQAPCLPALCLCTPCLLPTTYHHSYLLPLVIPCFRASLQLPAT